MVSFWIFIVSGENKACRFAKYHCTVNRRHGTQEFTKTYVGVLWGSEQPTFDFGKHLNN